MTKLFTSSGFLLDGMVQSPRGESIPLQNLPPFLRVLLTTDGTVTKSIESYFWEPVRVLNLGQKYVNLEAAAPLIDKRIGESVLQRSIALRGEKSMREYALAESLICTQYLSSDIRRDLEEGRVGIGELLRECGLETYREIMDIGYSSGGEQGLQQPYVWRTYRIVMQHHALIQITERFPLEAFK